MRSQDASAGKPFSWARAQRLHDPDPLIHWQRCAAEGLECPQEVFTQLFFDEASKADFAALVRAIDWAAVHWELVEISGIALRHVRVDRRFQHALDEAREACAQFGICDDREEIVNHWHIEHSWLVPPVIVAGEVLVNDFGHELLVGITRLGNLLGLLDREEISEMKKHLAWVGTLMNPL